MTKLSARGLFKAKIFDDQGEKIGRLKDVIVETRTGSLASLVIDKVNPEVAFEFTETMPSGELIVPISVVRFDEGIMTVDRRRLKLLSLKKGLKRRIISARDSGIKADD